MKVLPTDHETFPRTPTLGLIPKGDTEIIKRIPTFEIFLRLTPKSRSGDRETIQKTPIFGTFLDLTPISRSRDKGTIQRTPIFETFLGLTPISGSRDIGTGRQPPKSRNGARHFGPPVLVQKLKKTFQVTKCEPCTSSETLCP